MFDKQEQNEPELTAELTALESRLRRLTPAMSQIDRDRLMFAAGQAAVSRRRWPGYIGGPPWAGRWFWPAATATMTAASLVLATLLVWQRETSLVAEQVAKPQATVMPLVDRPHEVVTNHSVTSAPRSEVTMTGWPALRQPAGGYLSIRYIALTRGVGALKSDIIGTEATAADSANDTPLGQRELLNELLSSLRS